MQLSIVKLRSTLSYLVTLFILMFFLIEAAIHPMSLFSLAFRKHNEDLYDKATIENFNMVKALTAGFEEPYSVSFFIGRMVVFNKKNSDHIGKNRAYTGLLVSVGDRSIKDNQTHDDKWVNLEFKLKGTREKKNRDLDWSFRVGGKLHNNRDFVDTLYVGVRRSSTDYEKSIWSMINNSAFMTMVEVSSETFHLTGFESTVEKKFPLNGNDKIAFGLELGYLFNSGDRYRGELKEEGVNKHQLIFRPNLKF